MKDSITLSVPKPCHEKWDSFTPTAKGGFCVGCQKEVVDFTGFTERQLVAYLNRPNASLCGRFRPEQLRTYVMDPPTKPGKSILPWALLGAALALTSTPSQAGTAGRLSGDEITTLREMHRVKLAIKDTAGITTLTGIVRSVSDGLPMPSVNVKLKDSGKATLTDAEGRFTITLTQRPIDPILLFAFIGFRTLEISVPDSGVIHADMEEEDDATVLGGYIHFRKNSPRHIWWKIRNIFR